MIYRYIYSLIMAFAIVSLASCHKEELDSSEGSNGDVEIIFSPTIKDNIETRAIGDASGIDQLRVIVYESKNNLEEKKYELTENWNTVKNDGIALSLLKGHTYKLIFWAENSENTAYEISEDGIISVDYADYTNGGFSKMEELDAFYYCTSPIEVGSTTSDTPKSIELERPLAQLNFADNTTQPSVGIHKASVTYYDLPASFNPFTGEVSKASSETRFTFTDFPDEKLTLDGKDYYYVSTNYLFTPSTGTTSVSATVDLQQTDGTSINKFEFKDDTAIILEKNMKTNVLGSIVQQPQQWSVWDGTIPAEHSLTLDSQNRYIIDEAADIAWLSENGSSLPENSSFVQTVDIDMANKKIESIKLPAKSSYDGGNKTIKNYKNSLFGDITELRVQNINIENFTVQGVSHTGILANTLKGSSSFNKVTVSNSSVKTTSGAAGGMVGYIVRKSQNNRDEKLEVTFDDCNVNGITIEGSLSEGHYVGLLRGYDNGEILTFNDNCTLTLPQTASAVSDFVSPYTEGNEGAWLAENDYTKFNGWLGNEECYRGTVMYGSNGSNRFIPCWDGKTKIAPLTDGKTKLIYSAFDLANCEGTNPGTIKFMENVDLGAKVFSPLTNLSKLSGENKTIYNLKVETTFNTNSWEGGGFVRRCSAATIENITFLNADVKVTHVNGSDGDAYASIVCGTAEGTNVMSNVKVVGGKLYGCNKMGGIAGYITGTFTATNCVVDGLSIQNYDSGGKDKFGFKANGEVGGAFGFLAANATISGCYVMNTTLNCIGVNNGRALVFYKYAGRHVNEFIGDIRTTSGQTIRITLDEKNFTGNSYKNRKDQYSGCKYIGHCYYTNINVLGIAKIEDTKGTVYVNDKSITVAKNY